ncbi:hypothetical protein EF908_02245, partial [Streptomyces sp. WAC04770]
PPRPHQWFAERLLAVLSGQRPVHWMLGHTIGDAYDQLAELAPTVPGDSRSGIASTPTGHPVSRRYVAFLTYVTQRRATGARGHADQAGRSQGRAARTGCPGS